MVKEVIAIIIGVVFVALYIAGIFFCCGKGGELLAGYHYEPKRAEAKKYHKKFMLRVGLWYLLLIACLNVCVMCGIFGQLIVCYVFIGVTVAVLVVGELYFNLSRKIKSLQQLERQLDEEENNGV